MNANNALLTFLFSYVNEDILAYIKTSSIYTYIPSMTSPILTVTASEAFWGFTGWWKPPILADVFSSIIPTFIPLLICFLEVLKTFFTSERLCYFILMCPLLFWIISKFDWQLNAKSCIRVSERFGAVTVTVLENFPTFIESHFNFF